MNPVNAYINSAGMSWKLSWQNKSFRYKLFAGIALLTIILLYYPFFFQYIEKRNGFPFNDVILKWMPRYNVYYPIFILVWSSAFFILISSVKAPRVFLTFLIGYFFLSLTRVISILLFALATTPGL